MAVLSTSASPLDRARTNAYIRLLPLLFLSYAIAYVNRVNVSLAALTMPKDTFNSEVIGLGFGVFFVGYFLLEIPGTLLVEKWSARKWISRIMVSWGIMASATAFVKTPFQFYVVRFLLGLAEAGFFPGVIVYLTHWFPARDRARALAWFFIATPVAQFVSPPLSKFLLRIGTTETVGTVTVQHPALLGMQGWQWLYLAWGVPAVILGILVLFYLHDWPKDAPWLSPDERSALEQELRRDRAEHKVGHHHKSLLDAVAQAFRHPKVLLLAAAYFFVVTSSYGVESFLPTILHRWYKLPLSELTTFILPIPPLGTLIGQLLIGWSSDRTGERRLHASLPIYVGGVALCCTLLIPLSLPLWAQITLTVLLFAVILTGLKAYMPAFWALPNLLLTEAAAAGSIGLINSVGNLGGLVGPYVVGRAETLTHSFAPGLLYLCISAITSASIILALGLGHRAKADPHGHNAQAQPLSDDELDAIVEPV